MSFFPQAFVTGDSSFHPLFRLLDDFDSYSRGSHGHSKHYRGSLKSFTPKFDVKELEDAYELHGELPGIDQKDVEIEFTDAQTLTIKGRTERSYTSGTPPAAIEGSSNARAITEGEEGSPKPESHKATVEDEEAATTEEPTTSGEVTKATDVKKAQDKAKYWVSERSVGEFSRSFSFPVRVDQDQVTASMKNGVLSVTVPKAKKHESRKITIS